MNLLPEERNALITLLQQALDAVKSGAVPVRRSCLTCQNWSYPHCQLAGKVPPPQVVQAGCEKYIEDPTSPPF